MRTEILLSEQWREREAARQKLTQLAADTAASPERALLALASTASRVLGVGRVGVWILEPSGYLRCHQLFDEGAPAQCNPRIRITELGAYERALQERRVIAAADVRGDPLTRDIVPSYFEPLGIVSTLDAPIWLDGRVVGVVCHEHRGTPRAWTDHEAELALSVAEVASSILRGAELRTATEALAQAEQRMAELLRRDVVRRMTAGIAHDMNNLLAAASTTADVLERSPAPEQLPELAATLRDMVERAHRLCDQLAAAGLTGAPEPIEVDRAIRESERTLRAVLGDGRTLRLELGAPGATAAIDRAELERVLSNLVTNAREATQTGGHVAVRTSVADDLDGSGGRSIELVVEDDGVGMDELTRARVFAPYFSSKGGHRGLGLATVLQVVEHTGGTIHVDSEPARGARFVIRLPVPR